MTKFHFLLPMLLFTGLLQAQVADTLLFENFEWEDDESGLWEIFPSGSDATFVNWDADGLTPNGASAAQFGWYWGNVISGPDSLSLINSVMLSKSWMQPLADGNRNWLILPPVMIPNNSYTLHWKSAPLQLLRYMDGYTVLASEGTNDALADVFTDTLFQAAQMVTIVGDGAVQVLDNFTFSPGYIHADGLLDTAYYDDFDPTLYYGYLEPHSVSLSQYAGKNMYFAFLHDSDDDNVLELDDLLIVGNTVSGTSGLPAETFRFTTFPNPVENNLNVLFRLQAQSSVSLQITDMGGKIARQLLQTQEMATGEHQQDFNLRDLPTGAYSITLMVDGQSLTKVLVKK